MLDRAIIDHASPTLARLKLGNLFNHTMHGQIVRLQKCYKCQITP